MIIKIKRAIHMPQAVFFSQCRATGILNSRAIQHAEGGNLPIYSAEI
jgi:hypothetical protein